MCLREYRNDYLHSQGLIKEKLCKTVCISLFLRKIREKHSLCENTQSKIKSLLLALHLLHTTPHGKRQISFSKHTYAPVFVI